MATALITGASSGIGLELAKIHASKKDNLVLVARTIVRLNDLKSALEKQYGIHVHCIEKDLSRSTAAQEVYDETVDAGLRIDYLINNAGFGDYGWFHQSNLNRQQEMIDVNISSLTQLTHLFLQDMVSRKSGRIMNVASTAAFQPGPTMSVYFATKAYVLHFSEAINEELKGTGVTVTALCPGATISGFEQQSNMNGKGFFHRKGHPTSAVVATYGHRAMLQGKSVAIHGFMNRLLTFTVRFSPRQLVVKITRKIQEMGN